MAASSRRWAWITTGPSFIVVWIGSNFAWPAPSFKTTGAGLSLTPNASAMVRSSPISPWICPRSCGVVSALSEPARRIGRTLARTRALGSTEAATSLSTAAQSGSTVAVRSISFRAETSARLPTTTARPRPVARSAVARSSRSSFGEYPALTTSAVGPVSPGATISGTSSLPSTSACRRPTGRPRPGSSRTLAGPSRPSRTRPRGAGRERRGRRPGSRRPGAGHRPDRAR